MDDDPEDIGQQIRDYDPEGDKMILSLSAPPCPDFSQIKGEEALGKDGPEGQKFLRYCEFAKAVESKLPNKTFGYLVENVILQDRGEAELLSKSLSCNVVAMAPALVESHTMGPSEGPPIYWSSAPLGQDSGFSTALRGRAFPRSRSAGLGWYDPALWCGITYTSYVMFFNTCSHRSRQVCPKEIQRQNPTRLHMQMVQDSRQFAPWQYNVESLLHDSNGV